LYLARAVRSDLLGPPGKARLLPRAQQKRPSLERELEDFESDVAGRWAGCCSAAVLPVR
jgi:hypothetical protein